jgi:hypothetical protein
VVPAEARRRSGEREAAAAELNTSRVGRKARRLGRVETVRPIMLPVE